jgi:hypothetical protein
MPTAAARAPTADNRTTLRAARVTSTLHGEGQEKSPHDTRDVLLSILVLVGAAALGRIAIEAILGAVLESPLRRGADAVARGMGVPADRNKATAAVREAADHMTVSSVPETGVDGSILRPAGRTVIFRGRGGHVQDAVVVLPEASGKGAIGACGRGHRGCRCQRAEQNGCESIFFKEHLCEPMQMLREPGRPSHASCASRRPEGTNAVPASSCWRPGTRFEALDRACD